MRSKIVRDPVHQYIDFSECERKLIDTPWFQRLRHCSQNGPTRLVYPSILGTRFEHSLGVMDLASLILDSVLDVRKYRTNGETIRRFVDVARRDLKLFFGRGRRKKENIIADLQKIVRAAALCHDLGHFPLSHTLERAFRQTFWRDPLPTYYPARSCHEVISAEIVRHILYENPPVLEEWVGRAVILTILAPARLVVSWRGQDLPLEKTIFFALNGIIMGDYDADRLDYLQRDGYLSGSGFGHFDVERFVDAMMLTERNGVYTVLPSSGALSTIEAALIERYKLYKWVYFHHKTLFYDELCCEVGKSLLQEPGTVREMFRRYGERVSDPSNYLRKVLSSLGTHTRRIPPLVLFSGRTLGLRYSYYMLRPDFLIKNSKSHFFDDVWFCRQCRERSHFGARGKFYVEALVNRQPCGITIWKDWSQFTTFVDICMQTARQSASFSDTVDTENFGVYISGFLKNLWKLMREGDFPEAVCASIVQHALRELKSANMRGLRPVVRIADWRLFGNLVEKRLVGKTGATDNLVNHSILLRELSDLTGEIPFYAFIVGEAAAIEPVKKNTQTLNNLLTIIAKAFIISVVDGFGLKEIEGAWSEATRERR